MGGEGPAYLDTKNDVIFKQPLNDPVEFSNDILFVCIISFRLRKAGKMKKKIFMGGLFSSHFG